jgi:hypothetical protein
MSLIIKNIDSNEEFVLFETLPTLNKRIYCLYKTSILKNNYFSKYDTYDHNQEFLYYDVINYISNDLNLSKERAHYEKNKLIVQLDTAAYALLLLNINLL